MNVTGGPVNDRCYTPDVWFPLSVAAPVGVTDLYAKRNALAAILTFSQLLHLLECNGYSDSATYHNRTVQNMQVENSNGLINLQKHAILYKLIVGSRE